MKCHRRAVTAITIILAVSCFHSLYLNSQAYQIRSIPFTEVSLDDQFWAPRLRVVQEVSIPYTLLQSDSTGRIKNFEIAGGLRDGSFCTSYAFDDSDVFKIIEGAAYSLHVEPDEALESQIDDLINKIAAAQEEDGYLYTWRTIYDREKADGQVMEPTLNQFHRGSDVRWERVDQHSHELYNVGHLYEAGIAYYRATGKRRLLDVVLKNVQLVEEVFGWGKLEKATGHQEIEIGLIKLYELTGEEKYLDLAQFFLDVRGYGEAYMQNHEPVTEQRQIAGHAVRACYMYAAMADVAAYTGKDDYLPALHALWEDVVGSKYYITGGIGSSGSNEGFSQPYDLPNYSAYCETCASIAFVLWNQRMFQLTGDGKYIDVLERTLYNALNAGLSLKGDRFFYPNPLESRKNHRRSPWFPCACCPSNVVRFFPSIPGYIYAQNEDEVYVNLFIGSQATFTTNEGESPISVEINQITSYPWSGEIRLEVEPAEPVFFSLNIRYPGWARNEPVPINLYKKWKSSGESLSVRVNGEEIQPSVHQGYLQLDRMWNPGDVVEASFDMTPFFITADDRVASTRQRLAVQRGPLVYCFEGQDQEDERILNMIIDPEVPVISHFEADLMGGTQTLTTAGGLVKRDESAKGLTIIPQRLKGIPYFMWANRGPAFMSVWMPVDLASARPVSAETIAYTSVVSHSSGAVGSPEGIKDEYLPQKSSDKENSFLHWWPRMGTTEWVQYDFSSDLEVGSVEVYWLDDSDTGGGCRVPESWEMMYLESGKWRPVWNPDGYPVVKDGWSTVHFEAVRTTALRLIVKSQSGVSSGIHEWRVK